MARFIVSASSPPGRKWPAHEPEMRALFGVGRKWPAEGCKPREIQGIWVHVLPNDHLSLIRPDGRRSRARHRVIAACPDCGIAVPAGRLQQHKCKTKRPRRRNRINRAFLTAELKVARTQLPAVPRLQELARVALAQEYGTQEHEDAHNAFTEAAGRVMTIKQRAEWDRWCLKATDVEIVTEALRILGIEVPK